MKHTVANEFWIMSTANSGDTKDRMEEKLSSHFGKKVTT